MLCALDGFDEAVLDTTCCIQQLHAEGVDPHRLPRFSILRLNEPEAGPLLALSDASKTLNQQA